MTREPTLKEAMDFLELNAYEGSNAITTLRMGDIEEVLKPIRKLVNEHFNPQPYKFEELKKDMWVWDEKEKKCNKIIEIEGRNIDFYYITESIDRFIVEFEENRFFPVTKAMEYQKEK